MYRWILITLGYAAPALVAIGCEQHYHAPPQQEPKVIEHDRTVVVPETKRETVIVPSDSPKVEKKTEVNVNP